MALRLQVKRSSGFCLTTSDVKMKCSKKKPKKITSTKKQKKSGFLKRSCLWNTEQFAFLYDIWEKLMPNTFIQNSQCTEFYSQRAITLIEHVVKTAVMKDAPQQIFWGVSQSMHIHSPHALPELVSLLFFFRKSINIYSILLFPVQHSEKFLYVFIHNAINCPYCHMRYISGNINKADSETRHTEY